MQKPSITELLKLLDKPALLSWANKQGLQGIDISVQRNKWLDAGSSIHTQIYTYQMNKMPFHCEEHENNYKKFISGKVVLDMEKAIETEFFVGRYDQRYKCEDKKVIVDFKSNKTKVYLEQKLQLVAYGMGEECDEFGVVSIPDFVFIPVVIQDRKPYEEILKALSIIYQNKKLI